MNASEALAVLHRLWSETKYPPDKKLEHKRLWGELRDYLEARDRVESSARGTPIAYPKRFR